MRIDKFLKVSRIIKRRTLAKEVTSDGRIQINGRVAKPGTEVQVGDTIEIQFGQKHVTYEVLELQEHARKEDVERMYKLLKKKRLRNLTECPSNSKRYGVFLKYKMYGCE